MQPDGHLPVSPVEVRQVLDDLARDDEAHDGGHFLAVPGGQMQ